METILNYLEKMFVTLPRTAETIKAKEELRCMMEDKYNEMIAEGKSESEAIGIVISEFGDLKEVAEELGISEIVFDTRNRNDNPYRNQNDNMNSGSQGIPRPVPPRRLTVEETKDALKAHLDASYAVALGVFLCICAPTGSIVCDSFRGYGMLHLWLNIIGSVILFAMVGIAVALFIIYPTRRKQYNYIKKSTFVLPDEIVPEIRAEYKKAESARVAKLVAGIMLCIFSVVPAIIIDGIMAYEFGTTRYDNLGGLFLFLFVGVGVFLLVSSSMVLDTYKSFMKYEIQNK